MTLQQHNLRPTRFFPVLVGGIAALWLLLAGLAWLSNAPAARMLLALFTGGVLLAGFAWYGVTSWAWRRGRETESWRRPVLLFLFGWLLCLGSALASGLAPHGGSPDAPTPPAPEAAAPPSKLFPNGPRRFLSDLEGFDVLSGPWPVSPNGQLGKDKDRIVVSGAPSPKGIGMHPPADPEHAAVKYRLDREAAVFKATVAVDDTAKFCWTPAIFTVLGDGKELWRSKPIAHNHSRSQDCLVDVAGVDVLELRVHCLGLNTGVYAVWVEPRLLQKADTPDGK
jgi:hypothetical protein